MPLGGEGDITKINPNAFGFFETIITAPDYIQHPILQTKVKTNNGYRTISALGTWKDVIFSEEMYNAMNYGYKFNILGGYLFEQQIIFKEFIESLFKIKASVPKSHPMYLISKLLLNSSYGRWGLNFNFPNHYIVDDKKLDFVNRNDDYEIDNPIELSHNRTLISLTDKSKYDNLDYDDSNFNYKVSIPIAAAITAYARIFMSKIKNNPLVNLLYTDTDSAFVIGDLPAELVGNKLGQFKLEHVFKKLVILAPKVYGGILEDGTEIIKVKGLKKESIYKYLSVDILESLLYKNTSLEIANNKMHRSYSSASILIRNDLYTLSVTDNKRKLIYDVNNKFSNTESYVLDINKNIINK